MGVGGAAAAGLALSGVAPLQKATAQSFGPPIQTLFVRQDLSDCGNADVRGADPSRVGGVITARQISNGSYLVNFRLITAAANTAYHVNWKCHTELGVLNTGATGFGQADFTVSGANGQQDLTFDMYPAGAPAGNKYQSVRFAAPANSNIALAQKFAPQLRMDRAAIGYPMSAEPFYENFVRFSNGRGGFQLVENTDSRTLGSGQIPTYFQVRQFGSQVRINYWWFYGYQHPCFLDKGSHNGDWEHVMVTLSQDQSQVAAVTYSQHDGSYTRISGPRDAPCTPGGTGRCGGSSGFDKFGTHPGVYSGKIAHGSYHDSNPGGPAGAGGCAYYGDFRNPASGADYLETWRNLIDLDGQQEAWITGDISANWQWGPDGISNHPTGRPPQQNMPMCEGSPTYAVASAGCYKSECMAGDDQASEDCLKECKPGYTNVGLTCNKGKWPWEWSVYGRLTGGNKYSYRFNVPLSDVGLTRRRSNINEWDQP